ncbi:hypothetical protein QFZ43_006289 [Streptomyces afghaniensis]|nr:hypothetical protein [Streptomyces afghaniensis]
MPLSRTGTPRRTDLRKPRRRYTCAPREPNAPATAAGSPEIKRDYKTPVFVDTTIHGDEWEGTGTSVSGGRTVPLGTGPLFRDHPQGEFPQVAGALFTVAHSGSVEESG